MSGLNQELGGDEITDGRLAKRRRVNDRPLTHDDYQVGWVCALAKEQTAAIALLDETHPDLPTPSTDKNTYTLGSVGNHNVVIACLPFGMIGNTSSATVAATMIATFPSIKFGLMVGIGGGVPPKVRLGDVVVGTPSGKSPGVIQWDFGKAKQGGIVSTHTKGVKDVDVHQDGCFERTGALEKPPQALLTALTKLETHHELHGPQTSKLLEEMTTRYERLKSRYLRQSSFQDILFPPDVVHVTKDLTEYANNDNEEENVEEDCRFCDMEKAVVRKSRDMRVHYGLIATGNQVIKNGKFRDKLKKTLGGEILCFEMEAAGLLHNFPCLVIRGICDYADSHKNKQWQEHAAAVAAAFAKELLQHVQPHHIAAECAVKDVLHDILDNTSTIKEAVTQVTLKLHKDEDIEILSWLSSADYDLEHSTFINDRQPGTAEWFLNSAMYQAWLQTKQQILFCPGIPGAGKTTISAMVVNDLTARFQENPSIGIAYIYCNFKGKDTQKLDDLLASLLKQLSWRGSVLSEIVKTLYQVHGKGKVRPSAHELSKTLQSVVLTYSKVFLVVDALDECDVSNGHRTKFMNELLELGTNYGVNLLATSRYIPHITETFRGRPTLEIYAHDDDICKYVEGQKFRFPEFVSSDDQLVHEIRDRIVKSVQGMFLLARLHVDSLVGKISPTDMRNALLALPTGTDAYEYAYNATMERIRGQVHDHANLALNVLQWIVCARRPLSVSELQHALAVELGKIELDLGKLSPVKIMTSVCAGLVIVDENTRIVRLVHYTAQEYFEQRKEQWFPEAESNITSICTTYLSFSVFGQSLCRTHGESKARLQSYPLYHYAAENWGNHARCATALDPVVMHFLLKTAHVEESTQVLRKPNTDLSQWMEFDEDYITQMTGLHVAAYFGIELLVSDLLQRRPEIDAKDSDGRTPLWWAATNGHEAVVKLLLRTSEVDVNVRNLCHQTPLSSAAGGGYEGIVQLLLAIPCIDVNAKELSGQTPLSIAVRNGRALRPDTIIECRAEWHGGIVKLLLAAPNISVNFMDHEGVTLLWRAAKNGDEELVRLLLTCPRVNVNVADNSGKTPIMVAALERHYSVVRLLLTVPTIDLSLASSTLQDLLYHSKIYESEDLIPLLLRNIAIDVNAKDDGPPLLLRAARRGNNAMVRALLAVPGIDINTWYDLYATPLSLAAAHGHDEVVQLLLAAPGVKINARTSYGETPLYIAAARGHDKVVQLLLAAPDINLNTREDSDFKTPLFIASENGHEEVVQLLLGVPGVNPNAETRCGATPLCIAAARGYYKVVQLLLAVPDVDVNVKFTKEGSNHETPLSIAVKNGHEEVVQLLLGTPGMDLNAGAKRIP